MLFMLFACGVGNTDSLQISCDGKQCVRGIDHDISVVEWFVLPLRYSTCTDCMGGEFLFYH